MICGYEHLNWRPVVGAEGYMVTDCGTVWSRRCGRLLAGTIDKAGYRKVVIAYPMGRRCMFVHRLVAQAFVPGDTSALIRHLDGNKLNNNAANLAWGNDSENNLDKWAHGTMYFGEAHHMHKVPIEAIPFIRSCDLGNEELAKRYGVTRGAIYRIRRGKAYAWVPDDSEKAA